MVLFIEDEAQFRDLEFKEAIDYCEKKYGYQGLAWDYVKESWNMRELSEFLWEDGLEVVLNEQV